MKIRTITIWNIAEKKPDPQEMIVADTGQEWFILMYEEQDYGYEWEDDQEVHFFQWFSLGELHGEQENN